MAFARIGVTCVAWGLALAVAAGAVGGCQGQPKGMPEAARFKKAGKYKIAYVAEQDGTAYVVDEWDNTLKYSGPVRKGDRIVVDPDADKITVNDAAVSTGKVYSSGHVIYLAPAAATP